MAERLDRLSVPTKILVFLYSSGFQQMNWVGGRLSAVCLAKCEWVSCPAGVVLEWVDVFCFLYGFLLVVAPCVVGGKWIVAALPWPVGAALASV